MISEGVIFHLELPVPSDFNFEPIIVQFELLFQKPLKARALPTSADVNQKPQKPETRKHLCSQTPTPRVL